MEYIVYVKPDKNGYISAINSSAFLLNTDGWLEIDRGYGDRYHHAQGNYFSKSIYTDSGVYRYKLVGGVPVECTAEEIAAQEETHKSIIMPTPEERISKLEMQNDMLMQCILELSEILYA